METIAKYAYEIFKKGSFTKAAQDLYVSQPSLSAAISRLEKELGFRIFDRSTVPCSLTSEGRIYIESIEEVMESENNMRKRIKELYDTNHGTITVGGSSYASYLILSDICSAFYSEYPQIKVTVDLGNTGGPYVLYEKLNNRTLDVLVTYDAPQSQYAVETLCEERLIIAMHKKMPGAEQLQHLALTKEEILTKNYSLEREIEDSVRRK